MKNLRQRLNMYTNYKNKMLIGANQNKLLESVKDKKKIDNNDEKNVKNRSEK